ncbi:MAG TPA: hypothetical protein VLJ59_15820 [Mycobacteriales bacterium]|nr:hypothetical protein [Mycobacteriales bacterium]
MRRYAGTARRPARQPGLRRTPRRVGARALTLALAIIAALVLAPGTAFALPGDPDPPAPEKPGDGLLGWIDQQDGATLDDSVYGKYGYAGLRWHTYDLGVGGDLRDPWAIVDTGFGNWMFTSAKFFVGLANSLHQANRPDSLNGLDPVLTKGTSAVHDALFQPFLPIALLILASLLLWRTHRSDLPATVKAAGWALLVMTLAVGLLQYPVRAVNAVDGLESGTITQIDTGFAKSSGVQGDPALAQSETLVETVLYRQWLRGEFGNPDSAVAKKYGRDLLDGQAYSRNERLLLDRQPDAATAMELVKNGRFNQTAEKIRSEDPTAYDYLTGHGHSRMGAGFVAVAVALPTAGFRAMADLLVFAARIIIRLLVIFFPALAIAGILLVGPVRTALVAGAAAVVNSVVFSAGAGLNVLAANILFGPDVHLPTWLAVVFLAVISLIMWKAFKPFRHLTVMVNPAHSFATGALGGGSGMLRRFVSAAAGTYVGTRTGRDDEDDGSRQAERFRPESASVPDQPDTYRVRVASSRTDTPANEYAGLPGGSRLELPPARDGSKALAPRPGGQDGGRAEDITVYVEPVGEPVGAGASRPSGGDGRVPVHVTETITIDDGRHHHVEDAVAREVFRPGRRPDWTARAESLRATDAELVDGREVYVIYRPGDGLEARDVR